MKQVNTHSAGFIAEDKILGLLAEAALDSKAQNKERAMEIVTRARTAQGLSPEDAAVLFHCEDIDVLMALEEAAKEIKENIYGKRMVFFAPLYLSSHCVNNCRYCGYRQDNQVPRHRLNMREITAEVVALEDMGHKRLALECGEDPEECTLDYLEEAIATIYSVKEGQGSIRRVNVNIAATTIENYRRLKAAEIGTYILFQETYHRQTYAEMHPSGPKRDYDWHTTAHHRAMQGGIDDVGLGVLFGLYDFRFEVLAMLLHAQELERTYGVGPHTISVPRLRPANGVNLSDFPYLVNDQEFKKIVAILRLAVPYTGLLISTREDADFRDELLSLGISQLSAGSSTDVGGYSRAAGKGIEQGEFSKANSMAPQFTLGDHRSPDEMVAGLCRGGFLPSFCTACYRQGRTGDRFMALAKTGEIQNVCQPNAILTFKEYILDYASPATKSLGEEIIRCHLEEIKNLGVRQLTIDRLALLEKGERDLYF